MWSMIYGIPEKWWKLTPSTTRPPFFGSSPRPPPQCYTWALRSCIVLGLGPGRVSSSSRARRLACAGGSRRSRPGWWGRGWRLASTCLLGCIPLFWRGFFWRCVRTEVKFDKWGRGKFIGCSDIVYLFMCKKQWCHEAELCVGVDDPVMPRRRRRLGTLLARWLNSGLGSGVRYQHEVSCQRAAGWRSVL